MDRLAAELGSRLELRLELMRELVLEINEGETIFDDKVALILDGDTDEDKVIAVAVPIFDPIVNKFMASIPGQQLRLC